MTRAREKLVAGLAWLFTRLAIVAAPKPPVPPKKRWTITLDPGQVATFYVMFRWAGVQPGEWHVSVLCEFPEHPPLLADASIGRCWITPLKSVDVERVIALIRPEYLVTVKTDPEGWMLHSSIGPVTCVTLAKRLLGVHNPGVVTSRQLLDVLWRYRDGH